MLRKPRIRIHFPKDNGKTVNLGRMQRAHPGTNPESLDAAYAVMSIDAKVLDAAAGKTGIEDRAELVNHALRLLADADPGADFARRNRGALRGLRLDL